MRPPPWLSRHLWLLVPAFALSWIVWSTEARVQRISHLTALAPWSLDPARVDPTSATGYADGRRQLVIPEHANDSYQWIVQTQQMLASGRWRLRHVDYDNAPFGREVALSSPYRWWLAIVAGFDHVLTGRTLALAVEHGAFWADPLLQALLLFSVTAGVAWSFGRFAAALSALGTIALFPLGSAFLASAPDRTALTLLCAVWTVLPLVFALKGRTGARPCSPAAVRRWFTVSALSGALGLWVNVDQQWPVLAGILLGALLAGWLDRAASDTTRAVLPWRWWGLVGCLASLVAYAVEAWPDRIAWRFDTLHPVFALSWWGAGELVARFSGAIRRGKSRQWRADAGPWLLAIALTAAAPVAIAWSGTRGWLADEAAATRLTPLLGGIAAPNLWAWLVREGFTPTAWAALLPWLALVPVAWWRLARHQETPATRAALALALGAVLAATPVAFVQLRSWNLLDGLLLALLAVVAAPASVASAYARLRPIVWTIAAAAVAVVGLLQLRPPSRDLEQLTLTETEVHGLVERDFAQWLAHRIGARPAVVLAPPDLTTSLFFHASLPGIATLYPENHDGVSAAIRIVSANSRDETLELCRGRGVTHVVVPSWDAFLDTFAHMGTSMPERSFIAVLHRWTLPNWLRPVPYSLPKIAGMEALSVAVFEVVDEQPEPVAASRLTEYFLEAGQPENADAMVTTLRRYPGNIGTLATLAQVAATHGDHAAFDAALATLRPYVSASSLRMLPWDRRISVLLVLAQARQMEIALPEVKKCIGEADATRVRSLTTGALFRLQLLCKLTGLEIKDTGARALARDLLPPELRQRL